MIPVFMKIAADCNFLFDARCRACCLHAIIILFSTGCRPPRYARRAVLPFYPVLRPVRRRLSNHLADIVRRLVHRVLGTPRHMLRVSAHRGIEHCARRDHGNHRARDRAGRNAGNKGRYMHFFRRLSFFCEQRAFQRPRRPCFLALHG